DADRRWKREARTGIDPSSQSQISASWSKSNSNAHRRCAPNSNMKISKPLLVVLVLLSCTLPGPGYGRLRPSFPHSPDVADRVTDESPPREWIDPSGHRVIRLSESAGSSSFYFHQNGYTASGDKLVFSTPSGLSTIDLKTRKLESLVEGRASSVVVGRKTRQV